MNMDASMPISILRTDGGAVANNFLMQFQADILGIPVDVPVIKDTTPLGAAQLAALGIGEFDSIEDLDADELSRYPMITECEIHWQNKN